MSIYSDVDSRVQTFKGNPAALMKRLGMSNNLLDALALAKVKEMQESAKNKMIADMAQQQGQQPTVVEALQQEAVEGAKSEVNPSQGVAQQTTGVAQNNQRQQQAALKQIMQAMQGQGQQSPLMSGIAAAPGAGNVRMAGGGIVAFQAGGSAGDTEEAKREVEAAQARGDREAMINALRKLAAAGYDIATLVPRGLMGAFETGVTRPLRALGVPIPYLPEAAYGGDRSSMTPAYDRVRRREAAEAATRTLGDPTAVPGGVATYEGAPPTDNQTPPPSAPRPEAPRPAAPRPETPTQRESGLAYLQQQAAQRAGPPDPLGLKYREQVQADISMDPNAEARRIRAETEEYLAGPKAQEEAKARAAEVERRRGTLAESERNAPRRELIQALIGAGGRTSGLGALTAAGASGLNAALREESARERGMRDIFDLEEQARGLEAGRRGAAEKAGAAGRTETTRARTSALSSAGSFLNNEEKNRLDQSSIMAQALDRDRTFALEQAKQRFAETGRQEDRAYRDFLEADKNLSRLFTQIAEVKNKPNGEYAASAQQLARARAMLEKEPNNKTAESMYNTAAQRLSNLDKQFQDEISRARQTYTAYAKRAGINLGTSSGGMDLNAINAAIARKSGQGQ